MLSRISASSSMIRTLPLPLDIHSLSREREIESERRSPSHNAFNRNVSAMFLHDAIADRKPQARALSSGLGGKKRIVDLFDVVAADSRSGIGHYDFNARVHNAGPDFKH